jgi:hypothetical protein
LAACAAAVSVKALKSVDLPTFGRPTMPQRKPMKSPSGERHCEDPGPAPGDAAIQRLDCFASLAMTEK